MTAKTVLWGQWDRMVLAETYERSYQQFMSDLDDGGWADPKQQAHIYALTKVADLVEKENERTI